MTDIIGKSITHIQTQDTGIIVRFYPQIRDEFSNQIKDIPHVTWKSNADGELYASPLESVVVME